MKKRALVISGGGAKGAWGVGVVKALKESGVDYSSLIGTSTGSLMGPLILADRMKQLEEAYTSVTSKDIFNVNPFNKDGGIKGIAAALRIINGKESLGETEHLKDLIKKFMDVSLYNELVNSKKLFGATVVNLNSGKTEVKNIIGSQFVDRKDQSFGTSPGEFYNDIVNWIWASSNQPVFMSLFKDKKGQAYVDGGLRDYVSIKYVIENKLADEIDVIIHNTADLNESNYNPGKLFSILMRTISILLTDVAANDIENASLNVQLDTEVKINFYYMSKKEANLISNSLVFDKQKMRQLLDSGYSSVKNNTCRIDRCKITRDGHVVPG